MAQKGGASEIAAAIAPAFEVEYGLSLESLANNYDEQIRTKAQQAEAVVIAIKNSWSWRITAPLRFLMRLVKSITDTVRWNPPH